jgi:hypothetical protein
MNKYLTAAGMLALTLRCETAKSTEVTKATIEFGAYQGVNRDPYILIDNENERLQHISNMEMNVDLACTSFNQLCLFWDNTIASKASDHQYKFVSWSFRIGVDIANRLELGYKHLSAHEIDGKANPVTEFPLENVVFMQFKFIDRPRQKGGY